MSQDDSENKVPAEAEEDSGAQYSGELKISFRSTGDLMPEISQEGTITPIQVAEVLGRMSRSADRQLVVQSLMQNLMSAAGAPGPGGADLVLPGATMPGRPGGPSIRNIRS